MSHGLNSGRIKLDSAIVISDQRDFIPAIKTQTGTGHQAEIWIFGEGLARAKGECEPMMRFREVFRGCQRIVNDKACDKRLSFSADRFGCFAFVHEIEMVIKRLCAPLVPAFAAQKTGRSDR
jgi:hypothetical protein